MKYAVVISLLGTAIAVLLYTLAVPSSCAQSYAYFNMTSYREPIEQELIDRCIGDWSLLPENAREVSYAVIASGVTIGLVAVARHKPE